MTYLATSGRGIKLNKHHSLYELFLHLQKNQLPFFQSTCTMGVKALRY